LLVEDLLQCLHVFDFFSSVFFWCNVKKHIEDEGLLRSWSSVSHFNFEIWRIFASAKIIFWYIALLSHKKTKRATAWRCPVWKISCHTHSIDPGKHYLLFD